MEKQLFLFFPIKFSVKNVFQLGTPVLFQLPSFELVIFFGGFRILCSLFNTVLIVINYRLCFKYVPPVFPRFIEEFWEVGSQMTQQIVKLIKFFIKMLVCSMVGNARFFLLLRNNNYACFSHVTAIS